MHDPDFSSVGPLIPIVKVLVQTNVKHLRCSQEVKAEVMCEDQHQALVMEETCGN